MNVGQRAYALTRDKFFSQPCDLRDQLRRAALSISNNIAEGFERGSTAKLLCYLYIARGSAGRFDRCFHLSNAYQAEDLRSQISDLKPLAESCSRQIRAWADSLQNSGICGHRHLNDQTRKAYQSLKRREAFTKRLEDTLRKARPQDFPMQEEE